MKKSYDELFFTDDFLFSKIMRNPEIAKGVVENLLGIKVGKIKFKFQRCIYYSPVSYITNHTL